MFHIAKTFEKIKGKIQRDLPYEMHQKPEMVLIDSSKLALTSKVPMDFFQQLDVGLNWVFSWYNGSIPLFFILWFQEISIISYFNRHAFEQMLSL